MGGKSHDTKVDVMRHETTSCDTRVTEMSSRPIVLLLLLLLRLLRFYCAGQRSTPHYRTLEVRPGRIKLELKYDYDCERDDTNSLLGVLMFG